MMGGLIPAHAGKTTGALTLETVYRAHPRACGENAVRAARALKVAGSSPRMRGKLGLTQAPLADGGLIPAHAGKTSLPFSKISAISAHPRACGEN